MTVVSFMIVGVLAMPGAALFALLRYVRHRRALSIEARVTPGAFVGVGLLVAIGLYVIAAYLSIDQACSGPYAGNLCGMIGAIVIGPIVASLGMIAVAMLGLPVASRRRGRT